MPNISTEHFLDGTSGHQSARKTERSLPVLWSSCYLATAYKLQFCSKQFSFSPLLHKSPQGKNTSLCWLLWARQLNHNFHLSAGFEVVFESWRIPAKSTQRYETHAATDSAFLYLYPIPEALLLSGISQIRPSTTTDKNMGLFWLEILQTQQCKNSHSFSLNS